MEGKWLLCLLLVFGIVVVEVYDGYDDDVIDIEDDFDDVIEEVEDLKFKLDVSIFLFLKVIYKVLVLIGEVYFVDFFDRGFLLGWILFKVKKDDIDDEIVKYDGKWEVDEMKEIKFLGDKGFVLMFWVKYYVIFVKLNKFFLFDIKFFIVQYEVNFQNGIECGGVYVKLFFKMVEFSLD